MKTKTGLLTSLWLLLLVAYLDRVAISFAGPAMMKSTAMTPAQFGLVLSAFGLGHLLAQVPGGILADRWGAKRMLVLGPILWAVFTGGTALVATVAALWIMRAGLGAAEGLFATSTPKVVGENFAPRQRARAFAIFTTAIPLAPAMAAPVVGKLIIAYGWHAMFAVLAVPSLLVALICYWLVPGKPPATVALIAQDPDEGISFAEVLRRPSLWLASLGFFAFTITSWGYSGWMPTYLAMERHIKLTALGPISSIPYVFGFFGIVLGGWLGTRLYRRRLQLVACTYLGAGLGLILAYQAATLAFSVAGLSVAAFFLFSSQPLLSSIILDLAPERYRASYQGVFNTAGQIGGTIAPAVIGFLVSASGTFFGGFVFMIASLGVAAVCFISLIPFLALRLKPVANVPAQAF